jgi:molybdate transport system substrate-binding protein
MKRQPCRDFFREGSLGFRFTKLFLITAALVTAVQAAPDLSRPDDHDGRPQLTNQLSIAAAANLVYVLDALNAAFKAAEPHVTLTVATGASGNLVAQIRNGAPYDLFLSADLDYPRALVAHGDAEAKSLMTFAIGKLVLWTTKPEIKLVTVNATVRSDAVHKIALANIDAAPYGRAAKQALEHLGAWTDAKPKLVFGENITQTAQFVETGSADAGFVALSLVLSPKLKNRGEWILVPGELYTPLDQGAVLTRRGAKNSAAVRYLEFLHSNEARVIFERFGYSVPAK